eukprot:Em0005g868a
MAVQVCSQVIKESVVKEFDGSTGDDVLQLDLGIRDAWKPQVEALFGIKVIDTDAPSHHNHSPKSVLESGAKEKKRIYEQTVSEQTERKLYTTSYVS